MRTLLERGLIRMLGRKTEAGRPILYGTSPAFLEHFGFKDLGELPSLREIDELIGPPPPESPARSVSSAGEDQPVAQTPSQDETGERTESGGSP
jgi:segregation and condensation protein B